MIRPAAPGRQLAGEFLCVPAEPGGGGNRARRAATGRLASLPGVFYNEPDSETPSQQSPRGVSTRALGVAGENNVFKHGSIFKTDEKRETKSWQKTPTAFRYM